MSEPKQQRDLAWLPQLVAAELEREHAFLAGLRLSLAGLALRHVSDPDTGRVLTGLNNDIALLQAQVQQEIELVREGSASLRDLAKLVQEERAAAAPAAKETLH